MINSIGPGSASSFTAVWKPTLTARVLEYCGLFYLICSILLSFVCSFLFQAYMSTDLFWPEFPVDSASLFQMINNQLSMVQSTEHLDLINPSLAIIKSEVITINSAYPRLVMNHELTTIESAVRGLRNLQVSQVILLVNPYCWVDLGKRWEMAYTLKRQQRCQQYDMNNAAVHFESILRNINFIAWENSVGNLFALRIGNAVAASGTEGETWRNNLYARALSSVDDEIIYWRSFNLTHFRLQYGTGIGGGIEEKVSMSNAFGLSYDVVVKRIPTRNRMTFRTSRIMYNLLYNDLYALQGNQSLVRSSSNFFANFDPNIIMYSIETLPLSTISSTVSTQIGPLGVIDARWISPPQSLIDMARSFRAEVTTLFASNTELWLEFQAIAITITLELHPAKWKDPVLKFRGGNFMCPYNRPLDMVQQTFGFDDACNTQRPLTADLTGFNELFALAALNGSFQTQSICSHLDESQEITLCQARLDNAFRVYRKLQLKPVNQSAVDPIAHLQLGFMQLVERPANITIEMQPLLDPKFAFFGWMALYDWAWNERDAIAVQGDINSFNLLSYRYTPILQDVPEIPAALGPYFYSVGFLASITLSLTALLSVILWAPSRPVGGHWMYFNPVASAVWLNRYVMLIRSIMAMACLATVPMYIKTIGTMTTLVYERRPLIVSCLFAGESLWFIYVVHDILLPYSELFIRTTAVWTGLVGWLLVVLLDQSSPLASDFTLERDCSTINMDLMIYCSSGVIPTGQTQRVILIAFIHICSVIAAVLIGRVLCTPFVKPTTFHKLLPISLTSYAINSKWLLRDHQISPVTSTMSGIFYFHFRGIKYTFDVKLWRLLRLDLQVPSPRGHQVAALGSVTKIPAPSPRRPRRYPALVPFQVIGGFAYLCVSLFGNVAYVSVLRSSMANDFGWAGFNTTTTHTLLALIFNDELLVSTHNHEVDLASSIYGRYINPNTTLGTIDLFQSSARRQLFNPNETTLVNVIDGLRKMSSCNAPWVFTQYCWVDFGQSWEMASSAPRQLRCQKREKGNGAVYLESVLRNLQSWDDWMECWGISFDIGIADFLRQSEAGQSWLKNVSHNALSIEQEVLYWKSHSISQYVLQWQNFKSTGLFDYLVIRSALGFDYKLTLSHFDGEMHLNQQSSLRMYWSFASDLWSVSTNLTRNCGASLIRQSPLFAFTNVSQEILLYQNLTLVAPLSPGLNLITQHLGPFGNIDMHYVLCPRSLLEFYSAVKKSVTTLTFSNADNFQTQEAFLSLPTIEYMSPMAKDLNDNSSLRIVGGSIFCGDDIKAFSPKSGLAMLFGFDNLCHWWLTDFSQPSRMEVFFALLALNSILGTSIDINQLCAYDVFHDVNCEAAYSSTLNFTRWHKSEFEKLAPLALETMHNIQELNISIIQFLVAGNDTANVLWYQRSILDPLLEQSWSYFGWCFMYEWAIGEREVLSFEGDIQALTLLSSRLNAIPLTLDKNEIPNTVSMFYGGFTLYVTIFLIAATIVVAIYAVFVCGGDVEPWNLLEVNRLLGHVWVGRSVLIIRSVTALWVLNSSRLEVVLVGNGVQFLSPPLAWTSVVLASSELLWLVYMANNILSPITQQYTPYYVVKSTIMAWFVTAVFSLCAPQTYHASIHRTCDYYDMDFSLTCSSALVEIGSWARAQWNIYFVLASVAVTAISEIFIRPRSIPRPIPTLMLTSTSYFLLDFTDWYADGHNIYLDRASAFLSGMISIKWKDVMYVFDVKRWCLYSYTIEPADLEEEPRIAKAIPMWRVG